MSARIGTSINVGQRAMMNSQAALQTVSHNIANKNTEGYSRQQVETFSNFPNGAGKMRIGTGARAVTVQRRERRIGDQYGPGVCGQRRRLERDF